MRHNRDIFPANAMAYDTLPPPAAAIVADLLLHYDQAVLSCLIVVILGSEVGVQPT